ITAGLECFTLILMSKKSSSWRIPASCIADSTSASGVGDPYFSSSSFSRDPAFTPIRIGTPRAFASRAINRTLSWYLMLPGLIRRPWIPASRAAIAYFHWKWMSATTGTVDLAAIATNASASSQWGTATRTMSTPVATSEAICCRVALMSAVLVVVIDCTETGASPPIATRPSCSCRVFRRSIIVPNLVSQPPGSAPEYVERDRAVFGLVHLEEDQPLPGAERRLAGNDRNRVRGRRQQHRLDVRVPVLALVLVEVLGADVEIVVLVVDALVRHRLGEVAPEVGERAVLPLVDQQRARRMGAERDRHAVGDPGILDRAAQVVGQIEVAVSVVGRDGHGAGRGLHVAVLLSVAATAACAAGRSKVKLAPLPGRLAAGIGPPWPSTIERAIASPMPVPPPSSR